MIASSDIARVRRILPTAHAATTKEAIARAAAKSIAGPVLPFESVATATQIAAKKPAEDRARTIAEPVYRTVTPCPALRGSAKGARSSVPQRSDLTDPPCGASARSRVEDQRGVTTRSLKPKYT